MSLYYWSVPTYTNITLLKALKAISVPKVPFIAR